MIALMQYLDYMKTTRAINLFTKLVITAEISQIRNQAPTFSITGAIYKARELRQGDMVPIWKSEPDTCGCIHEEILKYAPELQMLVDLHLSDINGVPMYAVENSLYWLMNGAVLFKSQGFQKSDQSEETSLKFAAKNLRVSLETAQELRDELRAMPEENRKARMIAFCEYQLPRWKQEAETAKSTFQLFDSSRPWLVWTKNVHMAV